MSDEELLDLFDAEPVYNYKTVPNPKDDFAGFKTIQITVCLGFNLFNYQKYSHDYS